MEYLMKAMENNYLNRDLKGDEAFQVLDDLFITERSSLPVKYDERAIDECVTLCRSGISLRAIAKYLGVSFSVLEDFLDAHPPIARRVVRAYIEMEHQVAKTLINNAEEGDFKSAKYLLENRGTDWTDKTEQGTTDKAPTIQFNMTGSD